MSEKLKKGAAVKARTVRSTAVRKGTFVKVHASLKGDWYEIKPDDGTENFRTRLTCVTVL